MSDLRKEETAWEPNRLQGKSPSDGEKKEDVVTACGLCKSFDIDARPRRSVRVLDDISLSVPAGEFVSIVGPSGSGKSTLLYCLAGLMDATSGTVSLMGNDLSTLRREAVAKLRRAHAGFVFQSFCLIPSLNVADNVALPSRLAGKKISAQVVEELLDQVGLGGRGLDRVQALSGGEQQRVAVARALAGTPDVIFADEPTGSLDSKSGANVLSLLKESNTRQGRTVVLVTHDLSAAALADRAIVIRDGKLAAEESRPTTERLFELVGV